MSELDESPFTDCASFLDYAKQYVKMGLSVIPVKRGDKVPAILWKEFQSRKATDEELTSWFGGPNPYNIGIVTGNGFAVFDVDSEEGSANINALGLRSTVTVNTGRFYHLYFRTNGRVKGTIGFVPGVDVRGDGNMVVAPPSVHPNGKVYTYTQPFTSLADLPLYDPAGIPGIDPALFGLKEGNRDDTFFSVARRYLLRGYTYDAILNILRPHADRVCFPPAQLEKCITSAMAHVPEVRTTNEPDESSSIADFLSDVDVIDWLCPGLIAKKSIGFMAGLPETMKTWIMMDLAVVCASGGGKWLGIHPAVGAKVLFVDQERFRGETQRRLKLMLQHKGIKPADLKDRLLVRSGTSTRLDIDASFHSFKNVLSREKPELVIVDSFATFHTTDDTNRKDIQIVLERIKELRNDIGCAIFFIDHETKSVFTDQKIKEDPSAFRMSGSVGKSAAAEAIFTVRKLSPQTSAVYNTKNTLAATALPFHVEVKNTPNGIEVASINV